MRLAYCAWILAKQQKRQLKWSASAMSISRGKIGESWQWVVCQRPEFHVKVESFLLWAHNAPRSNAQSSKEPG